MFNAANLDHIYTIVSILLFFAGTIIAFMIKKFIADMENHTIKLMGLKTDILGIKVIF